MRTKDAAPARNSIVDRERDFHNARFSQDSDPREYLNKWYNTIKAGADAQDRLVVELSRNRDVLEYGCADGVLSDEIALADVAKSLRGIDISDVAIAKANETADMHAHDNARFFAMDAENMTFPARSFDLVFGRGIIHHLDLEKCYSEIARVLRPGGKAIFYEPMGHNPLLNLYRSRTPDIRTPDEHPLLMKDFSLAQKFFSGVQVEYFGLATIPSAFFGGTVGRSLYNLGLAADTVLLSIPFIRKYAWYSLITLDK